MNYKKCVKGSWWLGGLDENIKTDCIKVKAYNYDETIEPNFCYEKKWDDKTRNQAIEFAGEQVVAWGVGALVGSVTGGAGAYAGYCLGSVGASAVGTWLMAGEEALDKWPHGIDQGSVLEIS